MNGRPAMENPEFRRAIDELETELGPEPEIIVDGEGRSFGDFARQAEEAAKAGDEDRENDVREKQVRFLYDRFKKKYPELLQIPREIKGFYFFEVNSDNASNGVRASKAVLSAVDAFAERPETDEWKAIIDERKDEIMAEYRINVRPEKDYVPDAVQRLAEMFASSPELRAIASSFKVKIGPSARPDAPNDGFTEIIIYGANDTAVGDDGVPVAKKDHERLLAEVARALAPLEPHAQKDAKKRMSRRVNDLVSSAQSGGDFRGLLKSVDAARGSDVMDEYFDPRTGYAYGYGGGPAPQEEKRSAA